MRKLNKRGISGTHVSLPLLALTTVVLVLSSMGAITAGAATTTETSLPLPAGMCVTEAQTLIQQEKLEAAMAVLENFRNKQKEVDAATAVKKGYSHYYIDFFLFALCALRCV